MENLLTTSQVAELLNCSRDLVCDLIRAGRLRALNVGNGSRKPLYRIAPEAVAEYQNDVATQRPRDLPRIADPQPVVNGYMTRWRQKRRVG